MTGRIGSDSVGFVRGSGRVGSGFLGNPTQSDLSRPVRRLELVGDSKQGADEVMAIRAAMQHISGTAGVEWMTARTPDGRTAGGKHQGGGRFYGR